MLRQAQAVAILSVFASACSPTHVSTASTSALAVDSAQQARDERDILAAEHEWVRVTLKGDADAFSSFLADGYVALNSSGRFMDGASWAQRIRAGTTHYDAVELRDLRVRFPTRDIAVVTGAFSQTGVAEGTDNSHSGVYINTWARIGDRWRVVSSGFNRPPTAAR